jgi:hypothetical protein
LFCLNSGIDNGLFGDKGNSVSLRVPVKAPTVVGMTFEIQGIAKLGRARESQLILVWLVVGDCLFRHDRLDS